MGPFFQLNLGEEVGSFANMLHTLITVVSMLAMLLIVGFGATADGKWFRFYSYATILAFVLMGLWTFAELPRVAAHLPTPWMGVKERTGIYSYMLWLAVFAVVLLRAPVTTAADKPSSNVGAPQLTPR
jgi:hypothetical protein